MESWELPPVPPPWPSPDRIKRMKKEADLPWVEGHVGPMAKQWIADLEEWYQKLQHHFKFNPNDLASNVRSSWSRITTVKHRPGVIIPSGSLLHPYGST